MNTLNKSSHRCPHGYELDAELFVLILHTGMLSLAILFYVVFLGLIFDQHYTYSGAKVLTVVMVRSFALAHVLIER